VTTAPASVDDVRAFVREHDRVRVCGWGSKPGLSAGASLSIVRLDGIVEYDPHEFVVTVQAGMTVHALQTALAERGQVLPFDPPFADRGATVGGTIASGLSGAGRMRYGGVRDFLLGVTFVDATGELVRGGGRVVKNAAGFDVPKLMIGSAGDLGVIVEATFKIFPAPERRATVVARPAAWADALAHLMALGRGATELEALDLGAGPELAVRVGGRGGAVRATAERLAAALACPSEILADAADESYWRAAAAFTWAPEGASLLKAPVHPGALEACERACAASAVPIARRYSAGGHLAWVGFPADGSSDDVRVMRADFGGPLIGLTGPHAGAFQRPRWTGAFGQRLRQAFDPTGKFRVHGEAGPAPRS
jgi:glycolate oxidase FAD binding subunit